MEPLVKNNYSFSSSPASVKAGGGNINMYETKWKKHESLLYEIATAFGLGDKESKDIIQQAWLSANTIIKDQEGRLSFRTRLAKILVYQCIFKLGSELFSQAGNASDSDPFCCRISSGYEMQRRFDIKPMPLALRAVFILNKKGFNETEMAEILNTSPFNVKQRLNKAHDFLNKE